jgi:hypothetical protein
MFVDRRYLACVAHLDVRRDGAGVCERSLRTIKSGTNENLSIQFINPRIVNTLNLPRKCFSSRLQCHAAMTQSGHEFGPQNGRYRRNRKTRIGHAEGHHLRVIRPASQASRPTARKRRRRLSIIDKLAAFSPVVIKRKAAVIEVDQRPSLAHARHRLARRFPVVHPATCCWQRIPMLSRISG